MAYGLGSVSPRSTSTVIIDDTTAVPPSAYQYVNGLDADVNIRVIATYDADDDFSDAVELEPSTTVASGASGFDTLTRTEWDQVRFEITPTAAPDSGTFEIKLHGGA
jgi:hypothetical protein